MIQGFIFLSFLPFNFCLSFFGFTGIVSVVSIFLELLAFPRFSLRFVPFLDSMSLFLTFAIFCVFCKFHCVSLLLIDFCHVLCAVPWCIFFSYLHDVLSLSLAHVSFIGYPSRKVEKRVQKWPYRNRIWRPVRYCYC